MIASATIIIPSLLSTTAGEKVVIPTETKRNLDRLLRSYSRISNDSEFYNEFYMDLTQNVQILEHFRGISRARRSFFLKTALPTLLLNVMGSHVAEKRMSSLAEKHARNRLNVDPDLYEFWHDTLIALLPKYDDDFDEELESLWSSAIRKGIKMFTEAH